MDRLHGPLRPRRAAARYLTAVAHAVITLAVDLDRAGDADHLRRRLVAYAEGTDLGPCKTEGIKVTESAVAVDESLATDDLDL